jgi:hypothetical protein
MNGRDDGEMTWTNYCSEVDMADWRVMHRGGPGPLWLLDIMMRWQWPPKLTNSLRDLLAAVHLIGGNLPFGVLVAV